jgi:hypothetical protein
VILKKAAYFCAFEENNKHFIILYLPNQGWGDIFKEIQ